MKALGRLLVIWGTLLPLMILPSTADRIDEKVAILNIRLDREASIGWIAVNYDTIMILGLFAIGVGLSLQTLAASIAQSAVAKINIIIPCGCIGLFQEIVNPIGSVWRTSD